MMGDLIYWKSEAKLPAACPCVSWHKRLVAEENMTDIKSWLWEKSGHWLGLNGVGLINLTAPFDTLCCKHIVYSVKTIVN